MAERTIILKGERLHIRKEGEADGAITPGHFVQLDSDGKYTVNGTLGRINRRVAIERELENWNNGDPQAGSPIDRAYAAGDRLLFAVLNAGCEVYALVAAAATAVARGAQVELKADGTVGVVTTGTPIGVALEAVDNSGGGAPARIIIEIL